MGERRQCAFCDRCFTALDHRNMRCTRFTESCWMRDNSSFISILIADVIQKDIEKQICLKLVQRAFAFSSVSRFSLCSRSDLSLFCLIYSWGRFLLRALAGYRFTRWKIKRTLLLWKKRRLVASINVWGLRKPQFDLRIYIGLSDS